MKKILLFVAAVITSATMNAQEDWQPFTIASGFNFDAVAESEAAYPFCASNADRGPLDNHGCVWVTEDLAMPGLPLNGEIDTDGTRYFKLADYSGNNCLSTCLAGTGSSEPTYWTNPTTEGTLTFSNPTAASKVAFLLVGANDGDYPLTFDATPVYSDNSEGSPVQVTVTAWNYASAFMATRFRPTKNGVGNLGALDGTFKFDEKEITVDENKSLKAIKVNNTTPMGEWGGAYISIFAVSYVAASTGINDLTVDTNNDVQAIYTVDGRQVDETQKGINVVKMSNGKAVKVVRK